MAERVAIVGPMPEVADLRYAFECDLCVGDHWGWDCTCGDVVNHYTVPDSDLPLVERCGACGKPWTVTAEAAARWRERYGV